MSPGVSHFLNTVICDIMKTSLLDNKNQDQLMCVTLGKHHPHYKLLVWRQNIILSFCLFVCVCFQTLCPYPAVAWTLQLWGWVLFVLPVEKLSSPTNKASETVNHQYVSCTADLQIDLEEEHSTAWIISPVVINRQNHTCSCDMSPFHNRYEAIQRFCLWKVCAYVYLNICDI